MIDTAQNTVVHKTTKKQIKWWYPAKGYRGEESKDKWLDVYYRKFLKPTLSLRIGPASYFDNRLCIHTELLWISLWIHLPIYSTVDECEYPEFGWYYHSNSLVLCWNMTNKFIHMPWTYEWVRTSRYCKDGTWVTDSKADGRKDFWKEEWKDKLYTETHHYLYTTKYGDVQDDIEATIGVSEMEHRQKWLKWTKRFAKIRKSIEIEFSNEIGSERGSWKGGTIGCGYTMLPGETPYITLMRMQKERSFDR